MPSRSALPSKIFVLALLLDILCACGIQSGVREDGANPLRSPVGRTRGARAPRSGTEPYKIPGVYEIFWEYEVRPGQAAAFERLYDADGEWACLFRQADGYVETLLFRDTGRPTRYLTVDRWRSRAAFDAFVEAATPAYAALDRRGDALTVREHRIGAVDA